MAAIRTFVTSMQALRPERASLPDRIAIFVERWRIVAGDLPAQRTAVSSDTSVAGMQRVVDELGSAFRHARATGAFVNVWQVAGLGHDERRNAAALAWLLDPRSDHGLGAGPLRSLIQLLSAASADMDVPDGLELASLRVEHRPMNSERDRVDLVVDHRDLLLFIEIKIDALLGSSQLERYVEAAEATARFMGGKAWRVAFLVPRHQVRVPGGVVPLLWRDLVSALRSIIAAAPASRVATPLGQLLDHYASF